MQKKDHAMTEYSISNRIKSYWSNQPVIAKFFLVISSFVSASSLASLSETIFKWKGFVLDAVEGYRSIVQPIRDMLISSFDVSITQGQIDSVVIFGLFYFGHLRFALSARSQNHTLTINAYYLIIYVFMVLFSFSAPNDNTLLIGTLTVVLVGAAGYFVAGSRAKGGAKDYAFDAAITINITIAMSLLVVGVLAAVNKGLSM